MLERKIDEAYAEELKKKSRFRQCISAAAGASIFTGSSMAQIPLSDPNFWTFKQVTQDFGYTDYVIALAAGVLIFEAGKLVLLQPGINPIGKQLRAGIVNMAGSYFKKDEDSIFQKLLDLGPRLTDERTDAYEMLYNAGYDKITAEILISEALLYSSLGHPDGDRIVEDAFDNYKNLFEQMRKHKLVGVHGSSLVRSMGELYEVYVGRKKVRLQTEEGPIEIKENELVGPGIFRSLKVAARRMTMGDAEGSARLFDRASRLMESAKIDNLSLRALVASALETLNPSVDYRLNPKIESIWRDIALKAASGTLAKLKPNKEGVRIVGERGVHRDCFVFKTAAKRDLLEYEYLAGKLFEQEFSSYGAKLAHYIRFIQTAATNYAVSRRLNLPDLEEVPENANLDCLLATIDTLALIHSLKPDTRFEVRDNGEKKVLSFKPQLYESIVSSRIVSKLRRLNIDAHDLGYEIMELLARYKPKTPSIIHGDMGLVNILADGTIIDPERACIGHPMMDFSAIRENPKLDNRSTIKSKLWTRYQETSSMSEAEMDSSYDAFAIFNVACMVANRLARGDIEDAKSYALKLEQLTSKKGFTKLKDLSAKTFSSTGIL